MNIKAYTFSRVTPKETRGAPGRTTSLEKDTGVSKKWHPRPKRKIFQGGGGAGIYGTEIQIGNLIISSDHLQNPFSSRSLISEV